MAVDTFNKRRSVVAIGAIFLAPSLIPDGTIGYSNRRSIAGSYSASDREFLIADVLGYASAVANDIYACSRTVSRYEAADPLIKFRRAARVSRHAAAGQVDRLVQTQRR